MLVQFSFDSSKGLASIVIVEKNFDQVVLKIPLMIAQLQNNNINKIILMDKELKCMSMFQLYRISELFINELSDKQIDNPQIAVVKESGVPEETSLFLETVCQNRGLQLKFFLEIEDANDWLSI